MLATVLSRAQYGMEAPQVSVEVHLGAGLPNLSIVGLPEAVVKESKDRVRSALATTHFEFPAGRITVNLAPADLPKEGGRFDLPIALGILAASGQIPTSALTDCEFYGELSLSGELRPVRGMLPAVCQAVRHDDPIADCFEEARHVVLVIPRQQSRIAAKQRGPVEHQPLEDAEEHNRAAELHHPPPCAWIRGNDEPNLWFAHGRSSVQERDICVPTPAFSVHQRIDRIVGPLAFARAGAQVRASSSTYVMAALPIQRWTPSLGAKVPS